LIDLDKQISKETKNFPSKSMNIDLKSLILKLLCNSDERFSLDDIKHSTFYKETKEKFIKIKEFYQNQTHEFYYNYMKNI
jgi:hypothetical protein